VLKVELEEEEDEPEGTKITLAMIATVILTLATQLLFMKCKKRYQPIRDVITKKDEIQEEMSEDEFEIISNHEEEQEEMIPNRETQQDEEVEIELPAEAITEEPIPPTPPVDEGRTIYVTKAGEKCHLKRCDSLTGHRSYERRACKICRERTQQILTLNPNARQSRSESELTFVHENE